MPFTSKILKETMLKRDLLRDFCLTYDILDEQFVRYETSKTISFPILSGLLGEKSNKGIAWRLKDIVHHLLRNSIEHSPTAKQMDWVVGFLFHELVQLSEVAYQLHTYSPHIARLSDEKIDDSSVDGINHDDKDIVLDAELQGTLSAFLSTFSEVSQECSTLIDIHIGRCRKILQMGVLVFPGFLASEAENQSIARLFYDHGDIIERIFRSDYQAFLESIYGDKKEMISLLSAYSLAGTGQLEKAMEAANIAISLNPNNSSTLTLIDNLKTMVS